MKKFLTKLLVCVALLTQTSCITKFIWGDKNYEEMISQFFVGADGRYVVMIGQQYHYVFTDNSGTLKTLLSMKQKGILTVDADQTHLKLSPNNEINGTFVMKGPFSLLPFEDAQELSFRGFRPDKSDSITIKIELSGRRYAAKYLNQNIAKLSTYHRIKIYYEDSNVVKDVGKVAVTPIAVGLDAVLLIGKVIIAPFAL